MVSARRRQIAFSHGFALAEPTATGKDCRQLRCGQVPDPNGRNCHGPCAVAAAESHHLPQPIVAAHLHYPQWHGAVFANAEIRPVIENPIFLVARFVTPIYQFGMYRSNKKDRISMRLFKLFLAAIAALVFVSAAVAAETRVVPANRASGIFFYYTSAADNCYSGGKPKVHITREPAHGSIATAWKPFRMGKEAGKCAGTPMHGMLVIYKPVPGYHGPDKVSIIFSGGMSAGYFLREKEFIVDILVK
jgi:hypothetical protein